MIDATILTASNLSHANGIRHGFFTREGGISGGVYDSLNCGFGSDDDTEAVAENRRRVAAHLGASHDDVLTVHQIHSADALIVEQPFAAGDRPRADALVTNVRGLAVGALAADCTPVLFADSVAGVIGCAHAGWRGAIAGILEATLNAMEQIGAGRDRICTAIGPTIHQHNYEVGPEFEKEFLNQDPEYGRFFARPDPQGRPHFDLPGFCHSRLAAAGVGSIESTARCTYDDDSLFFSFRRKCHRSESDYGRQISAIVVT
ncbi:MAG: peptidoglycan editing factor PgeF [Hyphomicrobiaceae bacterium]